MDNTDSTDLVLGQPPELSITAGDPPKNFHLKQEIALYGETFARTLLLAWAEACEFKNINTAYNYWKWLRIYLRWVALEGEQRPGSVVADFYRRLRDNLGVGLTETTTCEALKAYASFVLSNSATNDKRSESARNKIFEATRSAHQWLADVGFLPSAHVSARIPEYSRGTKTPCMATLSYAGSKRADHLASPSHEDAARHYVHLNKQCLGQLRALLVQELRHEERAFEKGLSFIEDASLPCAEDTERAAATFSASNGTDCEARRVLCLDDPERHLALLVKYVASTHHGVIDYDSFPSPITQLVKRMGAMKVIRHLEGTSIALNAAFHIILIDTGWNVQPCWDLPEQPFVGSTRRGRHRVSTVAAIKLRAGGAVSSAPLRDGEADLYVKDPLHDLSGVDVIKTWQRMSAPIRQRAKQSGASELAKMLWILPSGYGNKGQIVQPEETMKSEWWPGFRDRHRGDPTIGGLAITRRVIRQTKIAIEAAKNDFDYAIVSALNNNSHASGMAFRYLSPAGIRALLADQIRKFQDLLEAVIIQRMEDVARRLGLDPALFAGRAEAGVNAGLGLFQLSQDSGEPDTTNPENLDMQVSDYDAAKNANNWLMRIVPTDRALELLHMARIAFRNGQADIGVKNPERWIRMWLPYHALVEAYCDRLKQTRHKARFERIGIRVGRDLASGNLALPYIW